MQRLTASLFTAGIAIASVAAGFAIAQGTGPQDRAPRGEPAERLGSTRSTPLEPDPQPESAQPAVPDRPAPEADPEPVRPLEPELEPEPKPEPERAPEPLRDPSAPPMLTGAAVGEAARPPARYVLPQLVLQGRLLVKGRAATAILEAEGSRYLVRVGSLLVVSAKVEERQAPLPRVGSRGGVASGPVTRTAVRQVELKVVAIDADKVELELSDNGQRFQVF